MTVGGQGGRKGTELVSSPISSGPLGGGFGGPDRTKPYRVVRPSPTSPDPSAVALASSSSPCAVLGLGLSGKGRDLGDETPPSRPTPPTFEQGGGASPSGAPVLSPCPPIPSPKALTSATAGGSSLRFATEDEAGFFEERAAIREHDGQLPRAAAERLAWLDVLAARALVSAVQVVTAELTPEPTRKAG